MLSLVLNKSCSKKNREMVKISVVIPIYNAETYLQEALDSVLNQTLENIEIICVNDGSKDNSLNIIKEYAQKDNRVKIIDKPNSGYGATVNKGIASAQGEFVAIFEPDDILNKNIYTILYNEAIENNLNVVKCNFYNYWSKKNKIKKSGLISKSSKKDVFAPIDNLKMFTCHASVWAGIYKKSFLEENDIKFLETPGASYQDISFTFKVIASSPRIKLIDKPLLYYRQDNPSSSINNPGKVFCVCDEYDEITAFLDRNSDLKELFNTQKLVNQYRAYLWNIKRLDKSLQVGFLEKFSKTFKEIYDNGAISKAFFKSIKKSDLMLLINAPNEFLEKNVNKNSFRWLKFRRAS